jgi:hypothetical protein
MNCSLYIFVENIFITNQADDAFLNSDGTTETLINTHNYKNISIYINIKKPQNHKARHNFYELTIKQM